MTEKDHSQSSYWWKNDNLKKKKGRWKNVKKKNMGGPLTDLNDPTNRDTVPAMLTPGEFVVNKEAAALFGPQLEAMNAKGLQQRQAENDAITGVQNRFWGGWIDKTPAVVDKLSDPTLIPRAIEGIQTISPYILSSYSPGGHPSERYTPTQQNVPYQDKIARDQNIVLEEPNYVGNDPVADYVAPDQEGGVAQGISSIPTEAQIVPNPMLDVEKKRGDYGANVSKSQLIDRDREILTKAYDKAMSEGRYDAALKIKKQLDKGNKKQEEIAANIDAYETEYHKAEKVKQVNNAITENKKLEELKKVTTDSNEITKIDNKIAENNKFIQDNEGGVAQGIYSITDETKVDNVPKEEFDNDLEAKLIKEDFDETDGVAMKNSLDNLKKNAVQEKDGSILIDGIKFAAEGIKDVAKQAAEIFGIEGSDFSKFLLGYLGSRLTGYDHAASMRFGGKLGLANINAREANEAKIAQEKAKMAAKGLDLTSDIKVFDINGTKTNAQWSKTHQRYVYTDKDGKTLYVPANATELEKGDKTLDIQKSFTTAIDSKIKATNAALEKTDFGYLHLDSKEISDKGIKFYTDLMKQYPKSEANSVYIRDKIKNASRQFVDDIKFARENDLPEPKDFEAYLNKATIKFRTGVSENDIIGTNAEQLTELDNLFRNEATKPDGKLDHTEYKQSWADAKKLASELKRNHKDIYNKWAPADYKEAMEEKDLTKRKKLLQAVKYNPMTYFAWLAETGNQDFLNDIKPVADKIFK